jgi:oxygen-dependent protoporphyrinogen oxidase
MDSDVLVIGAGLSGLVAAYRAGKAGLAVTVLEERPRPGGVIGSERRSGVLLERGPNSGLDTTPLINAMLADLGIAEQRVDGSKESSRRYVVRGGRLLALPTSPGAFLGTSLFSPGAKLRLFAEPFIARSPADAEESIAQFVRRRVASSSTMRSNRSWPASMPGTPNNFRSLPRFRACTRWNSATAA